MQGYQLSGGLGKGQFRVGGVTITLGGFAESLASLVTQQKRRRHLQLVRHTDEEHAGL
jgi:hypothetical protein